MQNSQTNETMQCIHYFGLCIPFLHELDYLEIMIAKKEFTSPRPILVVKPDDKVIVFGIILDYSDGVVKWNAKSIGNAIKRLSAEG